MAKTPPKRRSPKKTEQGIQDLPTRAKSTSVKGGIIIDWKEAQEPTSPLRGGSST